MPLIAVVSWVEFLLFSEAFKFIFIVSRMWVSEWVSQSRRVLGLHFNIGAQCRSEDILMGPTTSAKQALIHGGDQARGERRKESISSITNSGQSRGPGAAKFNSICATSVGSHSRGRARTENPEPWALEPEPKPWAQSLEHRARRWARKARRALGSRFPCR